MSKFLLFSVVALFSLTAVSQEPEEGAQATPDTEEMQTRMQAMREQMDRIHATEDPEERRRLMQEHMQNMHAGMMMMGRMMRGPMAEGQMGECRMNHQMMQQMMEQMMERMMQEHTGELPP